MSEYSAGDTRSLDNRYIRHTMRQPLLEREYESELAIRWRDHDDHKAMHELVMAYAGSLSQPLQNIDITGCL